MLPVSCKAEGKPQGPQLSHEAKPQTQREVQRVVKAIILRISKEISAHKLGIVGTGMLKISLAEVNLEKTKFCRNGQKDGMQDQNNKKPTQRSGE